MARKSGRLVFASRGSRDITGLGVGLTLLHLGSFGHHGLEIDISTSGVFVPVLTRVETRGIRGVSSEGLEGVEVHWGTGLVGVPAVVDVLLGVVVPKLVVVLSIASEKARGGPDTESSRGRGESMGRGNKGDEGNGLGVLFGNKSRKK